MADKDVPDGANLSYSIRGTKGDSRAKQDHGRNLVLQARIEDGLRRREQKLHEAWERSRKA